MAKDDCILLFHSTDLGKLLDQLEFAYGADQLQRTGDRGSWTRLGMSRRKLLFKSEVELLPLDATALAELQQRLRHVYQTVHTERQDILSRLLVRVATTRSAILVRSSRGLRGLEDVVFAAARAVDALIFWEGAKMLDAKGHLVMDFEGNSAVADLEVVVDAALLDQHTPATDSGRARKARSEAHLSDRKVPVNKNLPPIDGDENARIRSVQEVAGRALALMLVAAKGEGLEQPIVERVMEAYGIAPWLSPVERVFVEDPEPGQQDRINHCWRYEGLAVMLWALGYQAELPYPDAICDVPGSVGTVQSAGSHDAFLAGARLRPLSEILDQADLHYRLHWAVVDARIRGDEPPSALEPGVVYERHYALNWLRCYLGADWDDVSADT